MWYLWQYIIIKLYVASILNRPQIYDPAIMTKLYILLLL